MGDKVTKLPFSVILEMISSCLGTVKLCLARCYCAVSFLSFHPYFHEEIEL